MSSQSSDYLQRVYRRSEELHRSSIESSYYNEDYSSRSGGRGEGGRGEDGSRGGSNGDVSSISSVSDDMIEGESLKVKKEDTAVKEEAKDKDGKGGEKKEIDKDIINIDFEEGEDGEKKTEIEEEEKKEGEEKKDAEEEKKDDKADSNSENSEERRERLEKIRRFKFMRQGHGLNEGGRLVGEQGQAAFL